jgi:hypothetical protein
VTQKKKKKKFPLHSPLMPLFHGWNDDVDPHFLGKSPLSLFCNRFKSDFGGGVSENNKF